MEKNVEDQAKKYGGKPKRICIALHFIYAELAQSSFFQLHGPRFSFIVLLVLNLIYAFIFNIQNAEIY